MKPSPKKIVFWGYILAPFIYAIVVVLLHENLHDFYIYPHGPHFREVFMLSRTLAAAVSLFLFFPLIGLLYKKKNDIHPDSTFIWALMLAELPAIIGVLLFSLFGAFKTSFVFMALGFFYVAAVGFFSRF